MGQSKLNHDQNTSRPTPPPTMLSLGDRPMPADLKIEKMVLACAIGDETGESKERLASIVSRFGTNVFHDPRHCVLAELICEIAQRWKRGAIPAEVLMSKLNDSDSIEVVGGLSYVGGLLSTYVTAQVFDGCLEVLIDYYCKREALRRVADISQAAFSEAERGDLCELFDSGAMELDINLEDDCGSDLASSVESVEKMIELKRERKGALFGHATGINRLDDYLEGLKPGTMNVMAARPSIGKTALMTQMVTNTSCVPNGEGLRNCIYSLEMNREQLTLRIWSQLSGIPAYKIVRGDLHPNEYKHVAKAREIMAKSHVLIKDPPSITIEEFCTSAKKAKREFGFDILWVDYIQLIRAGSKKRSREEEVSYISSRIKELGNRLQVPVCVLAQLRRKRESEDGVPTLDMLRESGSIEQDADTVTLIHRQRYLTEKERQEGKRCINTQLFLAKHRNGNCGIAPCLFEPETTRLFDEDRSVAFTCAEDAGEDERF